MNKKKSIFSLLLKYKYSFIAGVAALSLVDLAQLAIPKVVQWLIDSLTTGKAGFREVTTYGLYILGIGLFMAVFRFGWRYFIMGAARKIENSLRNEFFHHLQSMHYDFFSRRKVGDLMAHTVNDIETLKFACGLGVLIAYDGIFLFSFIFIAMLLISPELTLYAFIPFPVLGLFMYVFGNKIEYRFQKTQDSFSVLTENARQSVSGIKVVKAFNREKEELKDFERASHDYLDRNINLIRVWGVYQPLITFFTGIATAIFLFYGGISSVKTDISVGKFTALLVYLSMLTWPMMAMGWSVDIMKRGKASINRLNKIFAIAPRKQNSSYEEFTKPVYGDISIRNLDFSYDGDPALRDITLEIPKGSTLGITGTTGSGKTTLLNLIMKVYEPEYGRISVNGTDINEIPRERIQENFIYVPQETTVFSGTIEDNITFMNPGISPEQVEEVAKLACIYDEIMEYPEGFSTYVGERGLSLSGGQRQRIAIARAVLLDPKVLILDDVLSSIDLQTESRVLKNIKARMKNKTLITVSSRVPSIRDFDQIAVFEEGMIIERGIHNELMRNNGIYSGMYNVQIIQDYEGSKVE